MTPPNARWTYPMHPEVVQDAPGSCPLCGMAAGVLYPVLGLLLNPMIAAAAMSLSSVSVIANSLRLRRLEI